MKKIILSCFAFMYWIFALAQFKNDNLVFKTIYLEELCNFIHRLGDGLLLDVRTPGEFNDTSMYSGLNIGRLKGAMNISSREINKRLSEIKDYQNKPVLLICSHSQRSRVVAKMLVDSGFTDVTNVNGGLTEFNMQRSAQSACLNELYETGNQFNLLSPAETFRLILNTKDLYIIDVRADSAFQGKTSSLLINAYGHLKNAVNYPLESLKENLGKIPRDKTLLIVDNYGDDSYQAAQTLLDNGFTGIHILFYGLDAWISESENDLRIRESIWENRPDYGLLSSLDFHRKMQEGNKVLILDIRSNTDFTNQNKEQPFRNRGHIKEAVNIPENELKARISELMKYRKKNIVVYAFSGNLEAFAAAERLVSHGFKKVKVLSSGMYDLRWRAANIYGMKDLMNWVVDVPVENY
ncbi:MAG: rhodanese-like domain-containing protein [Saprospiraceae bacterium]|nr:rhodanese-like domain-containing protein [Saprospiraceae bacterium]